MVRRNARGKGSNPNDRLHRRGDENPYEHGH